MTSTQLIVRQDLIEKLRVLTTNPDDEDQLRDLVDSVRELLRLVPDDPRNEKEYGFMVTLRVMARIRAMTQQDARPEVGTCVPAWLASSHHESTLTHRLGHVG